MDPETGAAGYMISGGLAGGSTGANIGVTLAGILDICISLYFVFVTAIALAECTIPLLGILLAAGTILCFYSAIHSLELLALYWETGDYEAANTLVTELVLNIAFLGLFKLLEPFVPGIVELLKNLAGQMKGVADIAVKYGQEVANMAARYGDDCITAINKYGLEFVNMIKKYSNCIDDVLTAIKRGIKPAEIEQLDELGIQPSEFEELRITSEAIVEDYIDAGSERVLSLSTRFLNKLDPLWENAGHIKPIEGYQDIICHGDKVSVVWKDANGVEVNISAYEFAQILKDSPVYSGGPIRLISCETGAPDAITAKYISKYLGVEVLAPTDIVYVDFEGVMMIGRDNSGTWVRFSPGE